MQTLVKHTLLLSLVIVLFSTTRPHAQSTETAQSAPTPSAAPGANPKSPGADLTPAETRQIDRFADLYEEYAQQAAETQARLKVLQEMQQKLMNDFNSFQAGTLAARGFKAGEAVLDLKQRKVTPVPSDKPATPSK